MSGYSWVSIISIFCYLFLFLSFASVKKREKVLGSFMMLLAVMILWNGGSFGMRAQLFNTVNFWHHVSLLGIFVLPYAYFGFLLSYFDKAKDFWRKFWLIFYLAVFVFNCITGFFIPLPEVVKVGNSFQFLYNYSWPIYLLFVVITVTFAQLISLIWRHCRGNRIALRQLKPIAIGMAAIFLGNALSTLPFFKGLPIDMLSGVVNSIFIFYALYKKNLFRMSILLSTPNYILMATALGAGIFFKAFGPIRNLFIGKLGLDNSGALIFTCAILVVIIAVLYFVISRTFTAVFTKKEQRQKAALASFSEDITNMLHVSDILQAMSETIRDNVALSRMFILIRGADGTYRVQHTLNPLEEKNFYLKADHPLISCLKGSQKCLLHQDFSRKLIYRSLWESEKALLLGHQAECYIPISSDAGLTGIVMLSGKPEKPLSNPATIGFLESVAAICAEAVKNASVYEKAIEDSRRDELTGLVNHKFFFEIMDREFETHRNSSLSLCIFNIDNFKLYNQLHGMHEGDLALQHVASILESSISENCYAARINGDKFALILPGYDVYSAKCLADTVSAQVSSINSPATNSSYGRMTVSVGICESPCMASSSKELYRNADMAVYMAKRNGKNSVQIFSNDLDRRDSRNSSEYKSGYSEHADTVYALTATIDAKDHYTFRHSQNVAYYATELSKAAGMTPDVVEIVREAGLLHDIGKISITEDILNKTGKLSTDEYEIMKGHVESAVNIIHHLPSLDYVIPAVYSHHERYDGHGYPRRLSGDNIPITGRILCIADSFDAITSNRTYKEAISVPEALDMMRAESAGQFDPRLIDIFIDLVENGDIELRTEFSEPVSVTNR